jgi:hypothetical protein
MLRNDLISACNKLVQLLQDTNAREILIRARGGGESRKDPIEQMLDLMHKLTQEFSRFNLHDHRVARLMGIGGLNSPRFWSEVIRGESSAIGMMASSIGQTQAFLPKLISLLNEGRDFSLAKEEDIVRIILPEEHSQVSTPERMATALRAATSLYDACTILTGVPRTPLRVLACDSGSDKAFDLLGIAKAIACLKEILFGIWDRLVSHRESKGVARIELVAKALPVLEQISSLADKIGPEQAELLRRTVIEGACDFVNTGTIIPEFEERGIIDSRILLAPEPKLLAERSSLLSGETSSEHLGKRPDDVHQSPIVEQQASGGDLEDPPESELSETEEELLIQLLKKKQKKNRQNRQPKAD